jgi:hypothetical protein
VRQPSRSSSKKFAQKRRLADAQRKLKERETKTARNEERISTTKIETALEKLSLLKGTQHHEDDDRLFPMSYGPIVLDVAGKRLVRLARYHLRQPGKPASIDRKSPAYTMPGVTTSISSGDASRTSIVTRPISKSVDGSFN